MKSATDKAEQYAQALRCIAVANNCTDAITTDLAHLLDFIRENAAVRQFLATTDVTTPGKQNALAELLGGRIHPLLAQFSLMLAAAGDTGLLASVAKAFAGIADDGTQIKTGEIHSAVPLSADRIATIETEVGNVLNCRVRLQPRVMNNILGGVLVKVGNFVIDGTLDTQLENARLQLMQ